MVQMQGSGSFTNPMCMLFGAKMVAGLRVEGNYCPEERSFPLFTEKENEIRRFLYLVESALGIPAGDAALEFPISDAERRCVEQISKMLALQPRKYVCIHPGARDVRRRWPPECFAFVADGMARAGYTVLLTGDTAEKQITARVKALMHAEAVDLVAACGHTGIGELAALIDGSAAVLCNDTGVSHIAAARKTPSVVVFSPHSDPDRWAPLDRSLHIPVYAEQAHEPACALAALYHLLHLKQPSQADESLRPHSYV
jgi:ADP-heptose:LPS heptosyltransferase